MTTYNTISSSVPADYAQAVTPSDTVDLSNACRGIFVGGGGTLVVHMMDGAQVTFTGLVSGQILPIRCTRILATGTTATNIVALY